VRDALVDAELQHLRVDHQHPQVLRGCLVQQAQHHRVDRDRLARTGSAGNQKVRHPRQVGHRRPAGDVLAQRQRQRAVGLVVFLGAQQFAQVDHLAVGVRRFQADHRLARDHVDHPHRLHRQPARDVLVQRGNLADLDPRRWLYLEAGDHRARIGTHHFRVDAEVLELEFDLPRQRFQGLLAVALGLRLGIVQQRQRRDAGAVAALEQRDLGLALGAVALLDHRRGRRLDLHRCTLRAQLGIDLARFPAFLAQRPGFLPFAGLLRTLARAAAEQAGQRQHPAADPVHHRQPRQPGGQGHRDQEQAEQEQVGAECAEQHAQRVADQLPHHTAAAFGQIMGTRYTKGQQAGGGDKEPNDADQAQGGTEVGIAIAIAVHPEQRDPGDRTEHQRQQERHVAGQHQQHVGNPRTDAATGVVDRRGDAAGRREPGIGRRIGDQAGEQEQQQRRHRDQREVAPQPLAPRAHRRLAGPGRRLAPCLAHFGSRACHL